ncbi:MAG: restriction endonuclease [Myxococcales bacterium]|nr:restriction endonuclease [Myxococcales bacterium]
MATNIVPKGYEIRIKRAVAHYWTTLAAQANRQGINDADRGNRRAVTGGKQMDGFCELVRWVVAKNGMPDASIFVRKELEIPGFFRPTKKWDLLVVHQGQLVAAVEFKSQAGPSFGNNFNNRTEEALGNATDLWTAFREGAFGKHQVRPWVGWLMFLEDCESSRSPVGVREPHFEVFDEFKNTSYVNRYELLLRKLVREKLYDATALIVSSRDGIKSGAYKEPAQDISMKRFIAGLGGQVQTFLGSV